jgi:hypothetical protein
MACSTGDLTNKNQSSMNPPNTPTAATSFSNSAAKEATNPAKRRTARSTVGDIVHAIPEQPSALLRRAPGRFTRAKRARLLPPVQEH